METCALPRPHIALDAEGDALPAAECAELFEEPERENAALRGAMLGILLGAALWAIILTAAGAIKL